MGSWEMLVLQRMDAWKYESLLMNVYGIGQPVIMQLKMGIGKRAREIRCRWNEKSGMGLSGSVD